MLLAIAGPRNAAGPAGRPVRRDAQPVARLAALCIALGAGLLGGCSIQPWVKPYERERLADPIMKLSRDVLSDRHREHVHNVREGSRGANGVQGGGCGCN
jgi:hypothetical protein